MPCCIVLVSMFKHLSLVFICHKYNDMNMFNFCFSGAEQLQNLTLEKRVTVLEVQMEFSLNEIDDLDFDVDFLFTEQALQDQQIFALDLEAGELEDRADVLEDIADGDNYFCSILAVIAIEVTRESSIFLPHHLVRESMMLCFVCPVLQVQTSELDERVLYLEENGGGSGDNNSSIVALEIRVTHLENVTANQADNICINTQDIQGTVPVFSSFDSRILQIKCGTDFCRVNGSKLG